jgi:predicted dehydrogenase
MEKPVTIGIIGCGVIAPIHAESFQHIPGVRVAWACDLVKAKAEAFAQKFSIPSVTADLRAVLDDAAVDCVSICTDHASHARIAVDALAAGKHVLCEKALAASTAGLDSMVEAQRRHPRLVFSGILQHRFDTLNRSLKRLCDDGVLGTPLSCSVRLDCLRENEYYTADRWRGTWAQEGGSVLINQAIHFVDIAAGLMGGALSVSGHWTNRAHQGVIETEDTAAASLQYANGAVGTIEATTANRVQQWEPLLRLAGTGGTIEIRNTMVTRVELASAEVTQRVRAELAACEETERTFPGKSYYGTRHPTQIADFVDAVRQGTPPFVTAEQARHCVDIALAVYESQKKGKRIEIIPGTSEVRGRRSESNKTGCQPTSDL